MLHLLRRHALPMEAFFTHSLVLTYALPRDLLEPMLPPGLRLDTYGDFGFVAIATVQTRGLRPRGFPLALGQNFFLTGYRIFTRFRTAQGRELRGLKILRSDADNRLLVVAGNLLTHYGYQFARVQCHETGGELRIDVRTRRGEADLQVCADVSQPGTLPENSPFPDLNVARQYAGPLPWTFDYERETNSILRVKGVRKKWNPQPVRVDVQRANFFQGRAWRGAHPILANAFHLRDVPYRWERGIREPVPGNGHADGVVAEEPS